MVGIHSEHSWGPNTFTSGNHTNTAHKFTAVGCWITKTLTLQEKGFEFDGHAFFSLCNWLWKGWKYKITMLSVKSSTQMSAPFLLSVCVVLSTCMSVVVDPLCLSAVALSYHLFMSCSVLLCLCLPVGLNSGSWPCFCWDQTWLEFKHLIITQLLRVELLHRSVRACNGPWKKDQYRL